MSNASRPRLGWIWSTNRRLAGVLFFFNDTATTEIYTLSLHDALPISLLAQALAQCHCGARARARQRGRCAAGSGPGQVARPHGLVDAEEPVGGIAVGSQGDARAGLREGLGVGDSQALPRVAAVMGDAGAGVCEVQAKGTPWCIEHGAHRGREIALEIGRAHV